MPGDHDDGRRRGDGVDLGQEPVQPGHAAVGQQGGAEAEGGEDGDAFGGDGQVRGPGGHDDDVVPALGGRAEHDRRERAGARDDARAGTERLGHRGGRFDLVFVGPGEQHRSVARLEQLLDHGGAVLRRLARPVDGLGHAQAQVAVMVDPGEPEVGIGHAPQEAHRLVGRAFAAGDLLNQRTKGGSVHDLPYPAQP